MGRRAIVMDRDGTLIPDRGYLRDPESLELLDGAAEALRRASRAGFQTVVVTNQSGVARGLFDEETLFDIHQRLRDLIVEQDARLDAIYHCPHHPDHGDERYRRRCDCRKPATGLLLRARDEMGIDLGASYMIGDAVRDLEAGARVGATPILTLGGRAVAADLAGHAVAEVRNAQVADDLLAAVRWIESREAGS